MIEKPIQELKAKAQSDQPKARASLAINEQKNIKSKIQTKQLEILNDVTPFYSIMDERARLAFKESSVEIKSATKLGFLPSVPYNPYCINKWSSTLIPTSSKLRS